MRVRVRVSVGVRVRVRVTVTVTDRVRVRVREGEGTSSLSVRKRSSEVGSTVQSSAVRSSHRKGSAMYPLKRYALSRSPESVSGCSRMMSGMPG